MLIVFKAFNDHIQHVRTYAEIRFRKCNQIFAVIWIDPHTFMHLQKPDRLLSVSEFIPHTPSFFIYIKTDYPQFSVPLFWFFH